MCHFIINIELNCGNNNLHISSMFWAECFVWFIDFVGDNYFGLTISKKDLNFLKQLFNVVFDETDNLLLDLCHHLHELSSVYWSGSTDSQHIFFLFLFPHIFLLFSAYNRIWGWDRSAVGFEIKESWLPVHLRWGMYCHTMLYSRLLSPAVAQMLRIWKCFAQIFMRCFDFNKGRWLNL